MTRRPSTATDQTAPLGRSTLPTWSIRYRKTIRLVTPQHAAPYRVSSGTDVLMRTSTDSVKVKVNIKSVIDTFITGFLNTIAMIRGVSWELASCTATSKADDTNTTSVNIDAAIVASRAWAELTLRSV